MENNKNQLDDDDENFVEVTYEFNPHLGITQNSRQTVKRCNDGDTLGSKRSRHSQLLNLPVPNGNSQNQTATSSTKKENPICIDLEEEPTDTSLEPSEELRNDYYCNSIELNHGIPPRTATTTSGEFPTPPFPVRYSSWERPNEIVQFPNDNWGPLTQSMKVHRMNSIQSRSGARPFSEFLLPPASVGINLEKSTGNFTSNGSRYFSQPQNTPQFDPPQPMFTSHRLAPTLATGSAAPPAQSRIIFNQSTNTVTNSLGYSRRIPNVYRFRPIPPRPVAMNSAEFPVPPVPGGIIFKRHDQNDTIAGPAPECFRRLRNAFQESYVHPRILQGETAGLAEFPERPSRIIESANRIRAIPNNSLGRFSRLHSVRQFAPTQWNFLTQPESLTTTLPEIPALDEQRHIENSIPLHNFQQTNSNRFNNTYDALGKTRTFPVPQEPLAGALPVEVPTQSLPPKPNYVIDVEMYAQLCEMFPNVHKTFLIQACVPEWASNNDNRQLQFSTIVDRLIASQRERENAMVNESITNTGEIRNVAEDESQKSEFSRSLLQCQCCYDDECMPENVSACVNGHIFCNACVIKGTDIRLGDGETHVPCFIACGEEFSLPTLEKVIRPSTFSILTKKLQAEEVMAAGLEGLVSCPFCLFALIPAEDDTIFNCLNPECMKASCIRCRELNHEPLTCDEVKKRDGTRKAEEEKMTEAVARVCYRCKKTFVKVQGCNKITCRCGATMCFVCKQPIEDGYAHFTRTKCPLWSDGAQPNRRIAEGAQNRLIGEYLNAQLRQLLFLQRRQNPGPTIKHWINTPKRK